MIISLGSILLFSLIFGNENGSYFPKSLDLKATFSAMSSGKEAILNLILGYSISKLEIYNKMGLMISPKTTFVTLTHILTVY
jgi:hypothetical protein